ncbi:hypothetical protein FOZ63_006288, partial [Perkinsus olseni]
MTLSAPSVEGKQPEGGEVDREERMRVFKAEQLKRCKDLFRQVDENERVFNACFWGSSIVVVGDGVICLGCGDWAMWSPFSMRLIKAHILRNHRKCGTDEVMVDGVKFPSIKQSDGFKMPTSVEECPTAEATLTLARDSPEAIKMWRWQARTAYGRWGVRRAIMAGSLRDDVLQPKPGMADVPSRRAIEARKVPKAPVEKPGKVDGDEFVDDGVLDGVRLPGKGDMHNRDWHVKEMVRWYCIKEEKAEELYAAGVRQAWPGSSFLGHDYKFVDWDMFCLICHEQRGRIVHAVSASSMESHLAGREHRKSLECITGESSPAAAAAAAAAATKDTKVPAVTEEELPPADNPHLKEWHVGQMVKWYEEPLQGATALYDSGIRQGWPGCGLLGDDYCFKEWEMFCLLCNKQMGKVVKAMHPDTMRAHIGGKAHKNNVQWASGEWQGGQNRSANRSS